MTSRNSNTYFMTTK